MSGDVRTDVSTTGISRSPAARARSLLGVIAKDIPIYAPALAAGRTGWLAVRNRHERLEPAPHGEGFRCDWQWSSDLHAPKVVPWIGRVLMRRALQSHPIRRAREPAHHARDPQVTFLIGHRGLERLPQLLAALESIAAQEGVGIECIVVEQDSQPRVADKLPAWVRHVHTPCDAAMAYCRSATFNAGALHARTPVLVLHDNDFLVPSDYAARIIERIDRGYEAVNLKRFTFYLDAAHTRAVLEGRAGLCDAAPQAIVQNLEGGGSAAITREAFDRIGGMDESFVGWGGEDNEFWERASTLKVWPWANLPFVHLWHESQAGKHADSPATRLYRERAAIDPRERIARLRAARSA